MLSSLLGGVYGYIAAALISAGVAGFLGYNITHKIDLAAINAMKAADLQDAVNAERQAADAQKSEDDVNLAAAVAEADAQQKIITHTVTVSKEVVKHVPVSTACIPYGLIRVLNDAATGDNQTDNPATAQEPDDSCAPISWRSFADELTDDYGIGRQNAEQLNALEANVADLVKAANQ